MLDNIPNDAIYGLIALNEFWSKWGEEDCCPNAIQGVNNDFTPQDFYTEENYKKLIINNNDWASRKLALFDNRRL